VAVSLSDQLRSTAEVSDPGQASGLTVPDVLPTPTPVTTPGVATSDILRDRQIAEAIVAQEGQTSAGVDLTNQPSADVNAVLAQLQAGTYYPSEATPDAQNAINTFLTSLGNMFTGFFAPLTGGAPSNATNPLGGLALVAVAGGIGFLLLRRHGRR
jgi:hypothetical protein